MTRYLVVVGIVFWSLLVSCTVHSPPNSKHDDEAIRIYISANLASQKTDINMPIDVIFCNATDDVIEVRNIMVLPWSRALMQRDDGTWGHVLTSEPILDLTQRDQCQLEPRQWKSLTYHVSSTFNTRNQLRVAVIAEWRKVSESTWHTAQTEITLCDYLGDADFGRDEHDEGPTTESSPPPPPPS
ncbi:MAG: hypothetical protein FWD61_19845 [Phycisphaerales bacterium]|nr:hypothetical protein [Phycisphaerales bacterium]